VSFGRIAETIQIITQALPSSSVLLGLLVLVIIVLLLSQGLSEVGTAAVRAD